MSQQTRERISTLTLLENTLDQQLESLEHELSLNERKYVILQALGGASDSLDQLDSRIQRGRGLIKSLQPLLQQLFEERQMYIHLARLKIGSQDLDQREGDSVAGEYSCPQTEDGYCPCQHTEDESGMFAERSNERSKKSAIKRLEYVCTNRLDHHRPSHDVKQDNSQEFSGQSGSTEGDSLPCRTREPALSDRESNTMTFFGGCGGGPNLSSPSYNDTRQAVPHHLHSDAAFLTATSPDFMSEAQGGFTCYGLSEAHMVPDHNISETQLTFTCGTSGPLDHSSHETQMMCACNTSEAGMDLDHDTPEGHKIEMRSIPELAISSDRTTSAAQRERVPSSVSTQRVTREVQGLPQHRFHTHQELCPPSPTSHTTRVPPPSGASHIARHNGQSESSLSWHVQEDEMEEEEMLQHSVYHCKALKVSSLLEEEFLMRHQ
ncbi:uncharacterized protein LOC101855444 [Aplysia californica]|uniref:Uncharacterized protein LOC101855444 n=1 Tax=Aplysia californica TaxID=6500 RepID=A0ABM0K2L1_APLCA|nr:uncharacterized protein LOC101855444 [Aplysia californica]